MGTDIESIQQTYQSLMRGNYAMLDNLKLGYGGTKSELERLVADAEKLTGQALDPAKFSDVITAIHAVQDNLGITGTTAKEAATTIEGSIGMMKAAWDNLLVGIANENGDLGSLIYEFAHTVETAASNILPRVEIILGGISQLIADMGPIIAQALPDMISAVLPSLISAGAQLLVGLVTGLISALPELAQAVPGILSTIYTSIVSAGPQMIEAGAQLLAMVVNGIKNGLPTILENGAEVINNLIDGIVGKIPDLINALPEIISSITSFIADSLPQIAAAGVSILGNLITGIISTIPDLVSALPSIIDAIVDGIGALMDSIIQVGVNIVEGILEGIESAADWLTEKVTGFFSGIVDSAKDFLGIHSPSTVFADMGKNMALGLGEGWDSEFDRIRSQIESGMNFGTANVDFASSGIGTASAGMVNGIASAVNSGVSNITLTANLMFPDGTKLATYQLPFLINAGRAAGTPIANPQVG